MTPTGMTVLLATAPVDMRRSFDGLVLWVATNLGRDAKTTNAMYVFVNRRRDMAKALWRDSTGWCLLSKRLDERVVALPVIPEGATSITVDARTLAALLDGVDRRQEKTPKGIARAARLAVQRELSSKTQNRVPLTLV